jgi:hypothetical protein
MTLQGNELLRSFVMGLKGQCEFKVGYKHSVIFIPYITTSIHNLAYLLKCLSANEITYTICIGRFIMFSVITNIYNEKTKGPTLMELFTATGKLKKFFF